MSKRPGAKREQECKKISRQRAKRMWWQAVRSRLGWGALLVFSLYAITSVAWFTYSGGFQRTAQAIVDSTYAATVKLGFSLQAVTLEGRKEVSREEVDRALNLKSGQAILAIPLDTVRKQLESIPRVQSAHVERILPNQIRIVIEERQPIAIWQYQGAMKLIDAEGRVMPDPAIGKYANLPLVVGEDAPTHAAKLLEFLSQQPELMSKMQCASRVGERRWNIRFVNGVELKLPEEKPEIAWQKFAIMQKEKEILARDIKAVDMRLQDRIFIKRKTPVEPDQNEKDVSHET